MVLCLSPHLDDAAFSAGAYIAKLTAAGESVVVATVFTATVLRPEGFALRCQTDKGYGVEVDYMAVRRAEDVEACGILGAEVEHWGFAEAPHRGYESARELFDGLHESVAEQKLSIQLVERIREAIGVFQPSQILYPIGAGDHVDHLLLIMAVDLVRGAYPEMSWWQWYDQPYVARNSEESTVVKTDGRLYEASGAGLAKKWRACAAYRSQVGYQFYGALGEERPAHADDEARIAAVIGEREWFVVPPHGG